MLALLEGGLFIFLRKKRKRGWLVGLDQKFEILFLFKESANCFHFKKQSVL